MRLYRIELYKLLCRKFFLISFILTMGTLFLYFYFVNVGDERSVVNGQVYTGIQAVSTDRKITEEYAGTLTDAKVEQIIETYGFPSQVEEYYGGFRDENYLNGFVAEHLGNGYMYDWENYKVSTEASPIMDTELGRAAEVTGKGIAFDYTGGWAALLDTLQLGMILGSILILIGVSPVFSEERQIKTAALLMTSREGKEKDVRAKTAAAFTLSVLIYAGIVLSVFLVVGIVYGFSGADCMLGLVKGYHLRVENVQNEVTMISVGHFAGVQLILDFLALNSLCAFIVCVSAYFETTFHTVVISCVGWIAPLLLRILGGGGGYVLLAGTPLFLVMPGVLLDLYRILFIPAGVAVVILIFCTVHGARKYALSDLGSGKPKEAISLH